MFAHEVVQCEATEGCERGQGLSGGRWREGLLGCMDCLRAMKAATILLIDRLTSGSRFVSLLNSLIRDF